MTDANDKPAGAPPRTTRAPSTKRFRAGREPLEHVAVRIPPNAVARIDALAVKNTTPWLTPTRSDMMRMLLLNALDAEEAVAKDELAKDEDAK